MASAGQVVINVAVGEDYVAELERRLKKYGISHGQVARESGIAATQLSRMFRDNVMPRMENIAKIERAIIEIRKRGITWKEEADAKNRKRWGHDK